MAPTPARIAALATCMLLCGCTTTAPTPTTATSQTAPPSTSATSSPTVSATPTPTPTWSTEQSAAIAAVDAYRAASQKIWSDPSAFTEKQMRELLKPSAGPEVIDSNVGSYLDLKKRGFRYDGDTAVLSTLANRASKLTYGVEVVVTRCVDQRGIRVLDKSGAEVTAEELGYDLPEFNLRQYTVQKRTTDKGFRVYGIAPTKGECRA